MQQVVRSAQSAFGKDLYRKAEQQQKPTLQDSSYAALAMPARIFTICNALQCHLIPIAAVTKSIVKELT